MEEAGQADVDIRVYTRWLSCDRQGVYSKELLLLCKREKDVMMVQAGGVKQKRCLLGEVLCVCVREGWMFWE